MYGRSHRSRSSSYTHLARCNFAIVAILTIATTALTAYLINVIVQTQIKALRNITQHTSGESLSHKVPTFSLRHEYGNLKQEQGSHKLKPNSPSNLLDLDKVNKQLSYDDQKLWNNTLGSAKNWHLDGEASESVETKVRPDYDLTNGFMSFKQRLAAMSKKDLLTLLKILQERIEKAAILVRKRNAELNQQQQTKQSSQNKFVFKDNGVVIRSEKMDRLMGYLEKIESNAPKLDKQKIEKLSALNDGKSEIKLIKPSVMDAILKPESMQMNHIVPPPSSLINLRAYLREPIESVAPEEGWGPQQPPETEDWPAQPVTVKPKKKKKKKKIAPISTTSTTTTTTTPAPPPLETSMIPASPAPPTGSEEVWIEEEEDIFRPPPRKKTKKYKKKTLPPTVAPTTTQAPTTTTTTTTTTSTTTTTTQAPTTSTQAPSTPSAEVVEDWPQDHWAQKQSTQAPWPETHEEEAGKWPEEEWLNFVRNHVQDQLNIIYV